MGRLEKRELFLTEIVKQVPDFHKQRRAIWSQFDLAYYEMKETVSFDINLDKFIIAMAY